MIQAATSAISSKQERNRQVTVAIVFLNQYPGIAGVKWDVEVEQVCKIRGPDFNLAMLNTELGTLSRIKEIVPLQAEVVVNDKLITISAESSDQSVTSPADPWVRTSHQDAVTKMKSHFDTLKTESEFNYALLNGRFERLLQEKYGNQPVEVELVSNSAVVDDDGYGVTIEATVEVNKNFEELRWTSSNMTHKKSTISRIVVSTSGAFKPYIIPK